MKNKAQNWDLSPTLILRLHLCGLQYGRKDGLSHSTPSRFFTLQTNTSYHISRRHLPRPDVTGCDVCVFTIQDHKFCLLFFMDLTVVLCDIMPRIVHFFRLLFQDTMTSINTQMQNHKQTHHYAKDLCEVCGFGLFSAWHLHSGTTKGSTHLWCLTCVPNKTKVERHEKKAKWT